jgi:hypothetical protein
MRGTVGLDGPISVGYLNYKASARSFKPQTSTANADLFASSPNLTDMFSNITQGKGTGLPF